MASAEERGVPTFTDPISAEEAVALYNLAFGKGTNVDTFRAWLRETDDRVRDFTYQKVGKRGWVIDRTSMLDVIEAQADRMLVVIEQERKDREGQ